MENEFSNEKTCHRLNDFRCNNVETNFSYLFYDSIDVIVTEIRRTNSLLSSHFVFFFFFSIFVYYMVGWRQFLFFAHTIHLINFRLIVFVAVAAATERTGHTHWVCVTHYTRRTHDYTQSTVHSRNVGEKIYISFLSVVRCNNMRKHFHFGWYRYFV